MTSIGQAPKQRLQAFIEEEMAGRMTKGELLGAVGVGPQSARYGAYSKALDRLADRQVGIRRLRKGVYERIVLLDDEEFLRATRRAEPLFHGWRFYTERRPSASNNVASGPGLLEHLPAVRDGTDGSNKQVHALPLGRNRRLDVEVSSRSLTATLATTDAPMNGLEFAMALDLLTTWTGVALAEWTVVCMGLNVDLTTIGMEGLSKVEWNAKQVKGELYRIYEHHGQGTRIEYHSNPRLSLETILTVLTGLGVPGLSAKVRLLEERLTRQGEDMRGIRDALDVLEMAA